MPPQNLDKRSNESEEEENGAEQAPFSPYSLDADRDEGNNLDERLLAAQEREQEEQEAAEQVAAAELEQARAQDQAAQQQVEEEQEETEDEEVEEQESTQARAAGLVAKARKVRRNYVIAATIAGALFNPFALIIYLSVFCVILLYGFIGATADKIAGIPDQIVEGISATASTAQEGLTRGAEDAFLPGP